MARAPALQAGCQGFKSPYLQIGDLKRSPRRANARRSAQDDESRRMAAVKIVPIGKRTEGMYVRGMGRRRAGGSKQDVCPYLQILTLFDKQQTWRRYVQGRARGKTLRGFVLGVRFTNSPKIWTLMAFISGNNNMVKRRRVYGECLGVTGRRRPWQAARSRGEEHTSRDPRIAEWGNPAAERPSSGV